MSAEKRPAFPWRRPIAALLILAAILGAALAWRWIRARRQEAPLVTAAGRSLSPLCAAATRLVCVKRIECKELGLAQRAACLEAVGGECERSLGWKVRAGVLRVDDEAREECLEGMSGASCNALQSMLGDDDPQLLELTSQCEPGELLTPRAGLGGPCAETSDCAVGFCPGLATQCHRCTAFTAPGAVCSPGMIECDPRLARCAPESPSGGLRCVSLKENGAPCTHADECAARGCREEGAGRICEAVQPGTACKSQEDCPLDAYCKPRGELSVCAPRAKNGEACALAPRACAEPEAACVAGKCLTHPFSLGDGQTCHDFTDCQPGLYCLGGNSGSATGKCIRQAAPGEACEPIDFGVCGVAGLCLNKRCHRLLAAGASCQAPYECQAFLSCVRPAPGAPLSCVADPIRGEPCDGQRPCVDSFCDPRAGRCIALAGGGAPCEVSEQCDSHWCIASSAGGRCYAPCAD